MARKEAVRRDRSWFLQLLSAVVNIITKPQTYHHSSEPELGLLRLESETEGDTKSQFHVKLTENFPSDGLLEVKITCPLESLPSKVWDNIISRLDDVSKLCLMYTNSRTRAKVPIPNTKSPRCLMWRITCISEMDDMLARKPTGPRFACAFCKKKHHFSHFGYPTFGIRCVQDSMINDPITRSCSLHVLKRINYSPEFRDEQQGKWARSLSDDRWITSIDSVCMHFGDRVYQDARTGNKVCPSCPHSCEICGHGRMHSFNRFGRERALQSVKNIEFVRRRETDYPYYILIPPAAALALGGCRWDEYVVRIYG